LTKRERLNIKKQLEKKAGVSLMEKISELWSIDAEKMFFTSYLKTVLPDKLFYKLDDVYYAYIPKVLKSRNQTLQSRNSLIGFYTEKWCRDLFAPIARKMNLYAVNGVVCEELGLTKNSSADLAFCTNEKKYQKDEAIKLVSVKIAKSL